MCWSKLCFATNFNASTGWLELITSVTVQQDNCFLFLELICLGVFQVVSPLTAKGRTCLGMKAGCGYGLWWRAQIVKLSFQLGTETTRREEEQGKELKGSSCGYRQRALQRPRTALGKPGSCLWLLMVMKLPWTCRLFFWVLLKGSTAHRSLSFWRELLRPNSGNSFWLVIITPVPRQRLLMKSLSGWWSYLWCLGSCFRCRHWLIWGDLIKSVFPRRRFPLTWSTEELGTGAQICVCQVGLWLWWCTHVAMWTFGSAFQGSRE